LSPQYDQSRLSYAGTVRKSRQIASLIRSVKSRRAVAVKALKIDEWIKGVTAFPF
jgi:hypothetical protein